MNTLFNALITSKMRIRILMRLFLNPQQQTYLRGLAEEFGASTSQVREELHHLSEAGLLVSKKDGRQTNYQANQQHPLFPELQSMVSKSLGMDQIVESVVERLGNLKYAYLVDDYAQGKDTGLIDLLLVGDIDRENLDDLVRKTEKYISRKIRTLVLDEEEFSELTPLIDEKPRLLLWRSEEIEKK